MLNVLIVEDDLDLSDILSAAFKRAGHSVQVANDGREALALLDKAEFDMILSDERMPRMTGSELLRHVRSQNVSTPLFFIMTGHSLVDENELLRRGAQGLLEKPVHIPRLLEKVQNLLSSKALTTP